MNFSLGISLAQRLLRLRSIVLADENRRHIGDQRQCAIASQIARYVIHGCLADQVRLLCHHGRRAGSRVLDQHNEVGTSVDRIGPDLRAVRRVNRSERSDILRAIHDSGTTSRKGTADRIERCQRFLMERRLAGRTIDEAISDLIDLHETNGKRYRKIVGGNRLMT